MDLKKIVKENKENNISIYLIRKIKLNGIKNKLINHIEKPYLRNLIKLSIDYSDLILKENKYLHLEIESYIKKNNILIIKNLYH